VNRRRERTEERNVNRALTVEVSQTRADNSRENVSKWKEIVNKAIAFMMRLERKREQWSL
jgi:hypothetical protein